MVMEKFINSDVRRESTYGQEEKTLPKNFDELIEAGELSALKEVFTRCELDARGGYSKSTALSFTKYRMNWFAGSWNRVLI